MNTHWALYLWQNRHLPNHLRVETLYQLPLPRSLLPPRTSALIGLGGQSNRSSSQSAHPSPLDPARANRSDTGHTPSSASSTEDGWGLLKTNLRYFHTRHLYMNNKNRCCAALRFGRNPKSLLCPPLHEDLPRSHSDQRCHSTLVRICVPIGSIGRIDDPSRWRWQAYTRS